MHNIPLNNILFLDIETVPCVSEYEYLDDRGRYFWDKKALKIAQSDNDTPETLFGKAGIYAEFGKIVCISCGIIAADDSKTVLRIKSFYDDDEKQLLIDFAAMLNKSFNDDSKYLCAHNGKEFDFPYIARRMLINGINVPQILDSAGKKPWDIRHLDTMELWKFGDYKHYTSLDLLTYIFNIPTPKDDIDGSQVGNVYWHDGDLPRIVTYCQKDVVAIVNLYLRFKVEPIIEDINIHYLT
ncbi:MAG: 3'-5' exonuclease [Salinivirgaceae bacterium]|nr:3'-5' exonuclease [Salinivirgaceae bacterium]MDD4746730.1 3'-5' exonuclease [Salinivirgaceae bacterium]MDY0280634.1 3'-5' exonuclease [Salinivirgaceae bacterium]